MVAVLGRGLRSDIVYARVECDSECTSNTSAKHQRREFRELGLGSLVGMDQAWCGQTHGSALSKPKTPAIHARKPGSRLAQGES